MRIKTTKKRPGRPKLAEKVKVRQITLTLAPEVYQLLPLRGKSKFIAQAIKYSLIHSGGANNANKRA